MKKVLVRSILVGALHLACVVIGGAASAATPNIIIVYADDQGYQDLNCFGSPHIKTPNIDSLAKQGMRFTSFYSAYCVCSAARASSMTGCYQPRLNMPGVLGPNSNVGLHPDEVTIADLLKTKGYATMCIGKWKFRPSPKQPELYDLEADISEANNLAAAQPEVVKDLQELIAKYDADLKANSRPVWRAEGGKANKTKKTVKKAPAK